MRDRSQLLKGLLEGCILKIIGDGETYGYEIVEKLKAYGFREVSEGTVYPLVLRLKTNKLVNCTTRESPFGPKRKYYTLSGEGRRELIRFYRSWMEIKSVIGLIFEDFKGEETDE